MVVILPQGFWQNSYASPVLISTNSKSKGVFTIFKLLKIIYSFSIVFPSIPAFNNLTLSCGVFKMGASPLPPIIVFKALLEAV
jgi:hypothetical protein